MPQPKMAAEVTAEPAAARAVKAEFPKFTLEDALGIPEALQRNGARPLDSIDMANALGRSPGSSGFRQVTAAANAYGLSSGSYKTQFAMGDLGMAITQPKSNDEKAVSLVAAALRPPLFQAVYDYYKGQRYPEAQFFQNTVTREFGVEATQAEKFVELFTANMRFVGLLRPTAGGDWLAKDAVPQATAAVVTEEEIERVEEEAEEGRHDDPVTPVNSAVPIKKKRPNRLFIGHGRNHTPLDQLTKTLDNLGIPYAVAESEPNIGRPISQKVRETMDDCGAAILIFSADVEYFDKDGGSVWRPSENVSHELGAAAVMYDDRVILFKEDSIDLASNYSGIGYITFEKDKLDAKVNELLRELFGLKILRVAVGDEDD